MKISHTLLTAVTFISVASTTQAALYDRGNGMIYDDVFNITWLQDANYAKTSGALTDPDFASHGQPLDSGQMNWYLATNWAASLVYDGFNDWRLPSFRPFATERGACFAYDGSCDYGYNNIHSELGHLFYSDLGNKGEYDLDGNLQPGYGLLNSSFIDASTGKTVSFLNTNNWGYWNMEMFCSPDPHASAGCSFNGFSTLRGLEEGFVGDAGNPLFYAWAVRDGDVAAVPVPISGWLFGSSLAGLFGVKRKIR